VSLERRAARDVDATTPDAAPGNRSVTYFLAFAVIYLAWGSTFLAIRIGVTNLPPLLFAAARALLAGVLLLALALQRRDRLPRTRREWWLLAFFGLTMITVPNGASTHALYNLPSSEVALLNASLALWIVGLGTLGPKGQKLTLRSACGLTLGIGGVALLVWHDLVEPSLHIGWQVLTLAGCLCWSVATIVYRNTPLGIGPIAFNACIMLSGGLGLLAGGIVTGEPSRWHWEARGMFVLLYLAVIGSALAYTAYAWLVKNAPTDRVATFAYVNPAIATLLGWLVLDETLSPLQVAAMLVILGSVALLTLPSRLA
jgi:drug/metabolite transporter (DMT)-like permease